MSATNRSNVRLVDDVYETPEWCVRRLFDNTDFTHGENGILEPLRNNLTAFDPCAGSGAIVRACVRYSSWSAGWKWKLVEKRKEEKPRLKELLKLVNAEIYMSDFLTARLSVFGSVDFVITNPPYSLAQEFIERCMKISTRAVVMLLRLNYLASQGRSDFMRANPPDVYVLPNRPCFTRDGRTDATEYAWFVWPTSPYKQQTRGSIRVLGSTPRSERTGEEPPMTQPSFKLLTEKELRAAMKKGQKDAKAFRKAHDRGGLILGPR